ncbi:hypothetical protein BAUCODRAFT_70602, partial [Baudoinia panamericana UAMH 10762]
MTPREQVLRLRRTDAEGQYLLVSVSQAGSKSLDLKLVASEGEHVYPTNIRETNVKSLQASNYSGSLEEWKTILKCALLHDFSDGQRTDLQGVESVAAISGDKLTITIRKNISGITQRLGSIRLQQNEEEEASLFDWACTAVTIADSLREQMTALQTSAASHQEQVAKLNRQLDDLVQAKKAHEEELLKKFAVLINEKKLKIRQQQRLLAK